MFQLEFQRFYDYSANSDSVVIPIVLRSGPKQIPVTASVDTGSSFCLFRTELADDLGLDLTSGIRKRFRTANSGFEAYGHEAELQAFGVITHSMIYFFDDPMINKNV